MLPTETNFASGKVECLANATLPSVEVPRVAEPLNIIYAEEDLQASATPEVNSKISAHIAGHALKRGHGVRCFRLKDRDTAALNEALNDPKSDVAIQAFSEESPSGRKGVRALRKDIFLAGFGPVLNEPPDQAIERTYRSIVKHGQDMAVTLTSPDDRSSSLLSYVVSIERGIKSMKVSELPAALLESIENRRSRRYFRTEFERVSELPLAKVVTDNFIAEVQRLSRLALFAPCLKDSREEFGALALRTEAGILVTGRGSSKSAATLGDVSLVTEVDEKERVLKVSGTGKKASLNASLLAMIFKHRPEINWVLHAHIPLAGATQAERETAPGTWEDWECARAAVISGANVINQPYHGSLILLKDLSELLPLLSSSGIYRHAPEWYDLAYARFQKNQKFAEIMVEQVPRDARILELAAGTGDLSATLLGRGFKNITLTDLSPEMLNVAKNKLHSFPGLSFHVCSMEELGGVGLYDAVCVRQAVNYIGPNELPAVFRQVYRAIKQEGGKFIFNSFVFNSEDTPSTRMVREEVGDWISVTHEGNLFDHNLIHHGQRTELFNRTTGDYKLLYDLNSFYIHTPKDFNAALKSAGFKKVEVYRAGKAVYFVAEK